ncbi:hypothetical protein AB4Z46_30830 [Variovorax sp. M-6]|uniref:hypothetical protein n=1 Tax=Variovorax sp. M-6 TaxID=3233041 RepID=UPI003F9604A5
MFAPARLIVAVIAFDQWRGASMLDDEEHIHGGAGAGSFVRNGQRVVTKMDLTFVSAVQFS